MQMYIKLLVLIYFGIIKIQLMEVVLFLKTMLLASYSLNRDITFYMQSCKGEG